MKLPTNGSDFLTGHLMRSNAYGGMDEGEQAGGQTALAAVAALPTSLGAGEGNAAAHRAGATAERRISRARRDAQRDNSVSVAIAFSLFLALLVSAVLVGGRAVIDPLLSSAAAIREANRVADIVYSMPDGVFCRHLSFDNATAELAEGALEPCPSGAQGTRPRAAKSFAWRAR